MCVCVCACPASTSERALRVFPHPSQRLNIIKQSRTNYGSSFMGVLKLMKTNKVTEKVT